MALTSESSAIAPLAHAGRHEALDVLRGFAVLGILLMNIVGFGIPYAFANPTIYGDNTGANFVVWFLTTLLFEGTLRGLFTLLFGAGVLLFISRLEAARHPAVGMLHGRRMLWLIAFGFVDSHLLLWSGDILFEYGVVGLALYLFRDARPRTLIAFGIAALLAISLRGAIESIDVAETRAAAIAAEAATGPEGSLDGERLEAVERWRETLADLEATPERIEQKLAAMRGGFVSAWHSVTDEARWWRTQYLLGYGFLESLGMMLLGAALFRLGALHGAWSARDYGRLALLGYTFGLTINALEMRAVLGSDYDPVVIHWTTYASYELGRVPLTLAHAGAILWAWRSGLAVRAARALADVGRMAFTNYLAQSLIGMLLFTGAGLGLYGQLERWQLYVIVAAIWIVQIFWSRAWLRRFQYGPAEWLWRALTYLSAPPLRRRA